MEYHAKLGSPEATSCISCMVHGVIALLFAASTLEFAVRRAHAYCLNKSAPSVAITLLVIASGIVCCVRAGMSASYDAFHSTFTPASAPVCRQMCACQWPSAQMITRARRSCALLTPHPHTSACNCNRLRCPKPAYAQVHLPWWGVTGGRAWAWGQRRAAGDRLVRLLCAGAPTA